MLTIPFGHTIDAFCWCLGEFNELSATTATRRPKVTLVETGEQLDCDVADQIAINGVLENGAVASVHFRGGYSRGTHFLWEITGTKGDLVISADGGHIQMLPLSLKGAQGSETELQSMPVPEKYNNIADTDLPDGPPASVARAYRHLMEDLNSGQQTLPGFDDAVVRHRLLEAIELSAKTGTRQSYKTTY